MYLRQHVLQMQLKSVPRPMKKQEKTFFVENLTEELKSAKSVILVDFAGLNVKSQQELKKRLAEVNSRLLVVKNTLLKLAGEKAKIDKGVISDAVLTGQTALLLADDDPIIPLAVLAKFAQEFETPKMKVGIIEGTFFDLPGLSRVSLLPSRDVLLGQLVGTLMSPARGLVNTLNGNMQKLVYILKEVSDRG